MNTRNTLLLIAVSCTACGVAGIGSDCDKEALVQLAGEIENTPANERQSVTTTGLRKACGDSVPEIMYAYYEPLPDAGGSIAPLVDKTWTMKERACPEIGDVMESVANAPADERGLILYDRCNFERYGVIDRADVDRAPSIVTWAMHQFLLDQGLDPAQAKPITTTLIAVDMMNSSGLYPLPGVTFPEAEGVRIDSGVAVHVSPTEITFNEMKIAALDKGALPEGAVQNHLIMALYDALAEEADKSKQMAEATQSEWDSRVILAADAKTPFATIVDVMFTAGRAEYTSYALVVAAPLGSISQIPVEQCSRTLADPDSTTPTLAAGTSTPSLSTFDVTTNG